MIHGELADLPAGADTAGDSGHNFTDCFADVGRVCAGGRN